MLPAYFDPIVPGLVPALTGVMRTEVLGVAVAVVVGMASVVCLVVLDVVRSRRCARPRGTTNRITRELRDAA